MRPWINKDQGGPSNQPPNQGPNLNEQTTKLEDTLTQFMQVSMSNHQSRQSAIKNLEVQVGQLAKQLAKKSIGIFMANTEKTPKEESKAVVNRSHGTKRVEKREENTGGEVENEKEKEGENE